MAVFLVQIREIEFTPTASIIGNLHAPPEISQRGARELLGLTRLDVKLGRNIVSPIQHGATYEV
jgi:hypothetical protein